MASWMRRELSKTGLLLVDDPGPTLAALCKFRSSYADRRAFKKAYESEVGRRVSKTTNDNHWYHLVEFGFLNYVPENKTKYKLTAVGEEICDLLSKKDRGPRYHHLLGNLLFYNDVKGETYRKFVKFVSGAQITTEEEVATEFRPEVARTLLAWSEEAGLIVRYKGNVWPLPRPSRGLQVTLDEFWRELLKAYAESKRTGMFGLVRIYVPVGELRAALSPRLGLTKEEFYDNLKKLLAGAYRERLRLHGGPTDAYAKEESFTVNGKSYIYLSVREN